MSGRCIDWYSERYMAKYSGQYMDTYTGKYAGRYSGRNMAGSLINTWQVYFANILEEDSYFLHGIKHESCHDLTLV